MIEEDELEVLYNKVILFSEKLAEHHGAMEMAAIFVNVGMTIYKTALSEQDYQEMIEAIYETRDVVKPFNLNQGATIQ